MRVLIAGGAGQIGTLLSRQLVEAGHEALPTTRKREQADELEALGARPVVVDLEQELPSDLLDGIDAVVFTAGAGPGSGEARKETVDYGAAAKLIDAAEAAAGARYVIVSAMGAGDPSAGGESLGAYLSAKARADERLQQSSLEWTVVRPGRLTDEPGTGRIAAATSLGRRGQIPREDTARVLLACLEEPATVGKTFEVLSGEDAVADALRAI
jgi:uncharacterized protein YbjT (DUF2867 family)